MFRLGRYRAHEGQKPRPSEAWTGHPREQKLWIERASPLRASQRKPLPRAGQRGEETEMNGTDEKTGDRRDVHQFPFVKKSGNVPSVPGFPEGGDVSVTTEPKSKTLEESLSYFGFPEARSTAKPRPSKAWTGHPREVAQKRLRISGGLRRPNGLRHPRGDWRRRNWARCESHRYSLRGCRRSLRFQKTAAVRWAASC